MKDLYKDFIKGIWVCSYCHGVVELKDAGVLDFILVNYTKLRAKIDKAVLELGKEMK